MGTQLRTKLRFAFLLLIFVPLGGCPSEADQGVETTCDDGVDNDEDGAVDCEDSDCRNEPACGDEVCDDGVDNDGDGDIDCADSDCQGDVACQEMCDDNVDNDGDGDIDCADEDCEFDEACREMCDDGVDNDGDGNIDCADSDCQGLPECDEVCDDGIDNDIDGDVDCEDFDCFGDPACPETNCADGVDNDRDGDIDCDDIDCDADPICADDEPNDTPDQATDIPTNGMTQQTDPVGGIVGPGDTDFFRFELCKDGAVEVVVEGDALQAELRDSDGTTVLDNAIEIQPGAYFMRYYGGLSEAKPLFVVITSDTADSQYAVSVGLGCPQDGDDVFDLLGTGDEGNNQTPQTATDLEGGPEAFETSIEAVLIDPEVTPNRDRDNYSLAVCGGGRVTASIDFDEADGAADVVVYRLNGEVATQVASGRQVTQNTNRVEYLVPHRDASARFVVEVRSGGQRGRLVYTLTLGLECPDGNDLLEPNDEVPVDINDDSLIRQEDINVGGLILAPGDVDMFNVSVCGGGVLLPRATYDAVEGVFEIEIRDGDQVVATSRGDGTTASVDHIHTGTERKTFTIVVRRIDEGVGPIPYDLDVFIACPDTDDVFDFIGDGEDGGNDRPEDAASIRRGPEPFDITLPLILINEEVLAGKHRDNLRMTACGGGRLVATASFDNRQGELELDLHSREGEGPIALRIAEGRDSAPGEQRLVFEIPFDQQGHTLIVEATGTLIVDQLLPYSLSLEMVCPGDNDIYEDNDSADTAHQLGDGVSERPLARLAQGDVDFYRLPGCARGAIGAAMFHTGGEGFSFVMELRDSDGVTVLATAQTADQIATIDHIIDRDQDQDYFIVIRRTDEGTEPVEYQLSTQVSCPGDDDVFDSLGGGFNGANNRPQDASPIARGPDAFSLELPLRLVQQVVENDDTRRDNLLFSACAGGRVAVQVDTGSDEIIELTLYRRDGEVEYVEVATGRSIARGTTVLDFTFDSDAFREWVIEAYSPGFNGDNIDYSFSITLECPDGNDFLEDNDEIADATCVVEEPPRGGSFVEPEARGVFLAPGDIDVFKLAVCDRGAVTARTQYDPQALDMSLELIAPDGQTVLHRDDADLGANEVRFILGNNPGGDYHVRVTRRDAGEGVEPYRMQFLVACPEVDDVFDILGPGENGGNDRPEDAVAIGVGPDAFEQEIPLVLIDPELAANKHRDNFLIEACGGGRLNVDVAHDSEQGEVALRIHTDGQNPQQLAEGDTSLVYDVPGGESAFLVVEAIGSNFSGQSIQYTLNLRLRCPDLEDDVLEENDSVDEASIISPGEIPDLIIVQGDPDWFAVEVCTNGRLSVGTVADPEPREVSITTDVLRGNDVVGSGVNIVVDNLASTQTYHVRVTATGEGRRGYALSVAVECPLDDREEENDSPGAPSVFDADLALIGLFVPELNVAPEDPDYYAVDVCSGGRLSAEISNNINPLELEIRVGDTVLATGDATVSAFNASPTTRRLVIGVTTTLGDRFEPQDYALTVAVACPGNDGLEPNDGEQNFTAIPSDQNTTHEDLIIHTGDVDLFGGQACRGGSVEAVVIPTTLPGTVSVTLSVGGVLRDSGIFVDIVNPLRADFGDAGPETNWRLRVTTTDVLEKGYRVVISHRCPDVEICNDGIDNNDNNLIDCADPDCDCDPPVIFIPFVPGTTNSGRPTLPPLQGTWSGTLDGCQDDLGEALGFYAYPVVNATGSDQLIRIQTNFFDELGLTFAFAGTFDPQQPTLNCIPGLRDPNRIFADNFYDMLVGDGETLIVVVSDDFFGVPVGDHRIQITTQGPPEDACEDGEDGDHDGQADCDDDDCDGDCRRQHCEQPYRFLTAPGVYDFDFIDADDNFSAPCDDGFGRGDRVFTFTPDNLDGPTTFCVDTLLSNRTATVFLTDEDCVNTDPGNACTTGGQVEFTANPGETRHIVTELLGSAFDEDLLNLTIVQGSCAETICDDGEDNDDDGFTDCEDSECAGDPACVPVINIAGPGEFVDFQFLGGGEDLRGDRPRIDCGPGDGDTYDYRLAVISNQSAFGETLDLFATHNNHNGTLHVFDVAIEDFDIANRDGCLFDDANGSFSDRSEIDDVPLGPGESRVLLFSTFRGRRTLGDIDLRITTQALIEICDDSGDNDRDDLIDCDDPDCVAFPACMEIGQCEDGVDNDGDDAVDCDDADCAQDPACDPDEELICDDGLDNDNDTRTDCADQTCALTDECVETSLVGNGFLNQFWETTSPTWEGDQTFCGLPVIDGFPYVTARLVNNGAARNARLRLFPDGNNSIFVFDGGFDNCVAAATIENGVAEIPSVELPEGGSLLYVATPNAAIALPFPAALQVSNP